MVLMQNYTLILSSALPVPVSEATLICPSEGNFSGAIPCPLSLTDSSPEKLPSLGQISVASETGTGSALENLNRRLTGLYEATLICPSEGNFSGAIPCPLSLTDSFNEASLY
jgi:hypothetical protein